MGYPYEDERSILNYFKKFMFPHMMDNNRACELELTLTPQMKLTLDFVNGTLNGVADARLQKMLCKARTLYIEYDNKLYIAYNDELDGHTSNAPTAGHVTHTFKEYPLDILIIKNTYPDNTSYEHQETQVVIKVAGRHDIT